MATKSPVPAASSPRETVTTTKPIAKSTETPAPGPREETIRWVRAGLGHWEDVQNWEETSTRAQRVPTEEDIVYVPRLIEGYTVSVQVVQAGPKTVKKLINEGIIAGQRGEHNPAGSVELHAREALINRGKIQAESNPTGEGGSVILKAPTLDNRDTIEAGDTNFVEAPGGSLTIEAGHFVNKGDLRSGRSERGAGGTIRIHAKQFANHKRLTAGRSDQEGRPGGEIVIRVADSFSQYDGRIVAGRSAEKREPSPDNNKRQRPKIVFLGRGGSITIQGGEIHIFSGRLTAGEGAPYGDIRFETDRTITISSNKPQLEANLIVLVARRVIHLWSLRKEALKSRAEKDTVGIIVSTCEQLDLKFNPKETVLLTGTEGALIQFGVPSKATKNLALESGTSWEKLSQPAPQLVEPVQACTP
jgi:hypothetical protein